MLKQLFIKNFTLIDTLDIQFNPGFSVITGETGAGKSIILGAIGLLLGQRADSKAIKAGASKCVIEAHFDLSRYAMAIECKARTAEKAAEKDVDKKPIADMYREMRDALRLFPVDMPKQLPADAAQVYLAFLAGSVNSKTDLTENPVLALLEKGFSEVKAEVEKAKKENRAPSNTKINAACKDMVQQYGGTMIARAKTKNLADTLNAIFYPVQRIDRKTGLIKSYSAAWFRGFEQYALLITRAALENTGEKTVK